MKLLAGEPEVAAKAPARLALEPWEAPASAVALRGLAAVLLRGEEALLVSSNEDEATGIGEGRGTAGLKASANSSRLTKLLPSESSLLMIAMTSESVAMKPLSLRKVWMFLWLRE